jgi:7-cyano-7-deazaguanine synthase
MSKKPGSTTAVVLLSGGLDSSFNFYKALIQNRIVVALTFNYGQRAALQEIASAARLAREAAVDHEIIDLPWFRSFTRTALVSGSGIPSGGAVAIDDAERSAATAKSVWVPNRNGILLNIAAGFAEGMGAEVVIPGFNLEEAQTFPDNSAAFLATLDASWKLSTATGVRTQCYSTGLTKTQIVAQGVKLELPFADLWPCYLDGDRWCGQCESCQRYARALAANGLSFEALQG